MQEEWDGVARARRSVEAMVVTGMEAHQRRLAELIARAETMDAVMRATEEERQAAHIAVGTLDEVTNDLRH